VAAALNRFSAERRRARVARPRSIVHPLRPPAGFSAPTRRRSPTARGACCRVLTRCHASSSRGARRREPPREREAEAKRKIEREGVRQRRDGKKGSRGVEREGERAMPTTSTRATATRARDGEGWRSIFASQSDPAASRFDAFRCPRDVQPPTADGGGGGVGGSGGGRAERAATPGVLPPGVHGAPVEFFRNWRKGVRREKCESPRRVECERLTFHPLNDGRFVFRKPPVEIGFSLRIKHRAGD